MKLSNTVAIVTGGGSGIGRGICHKFAEEGAKVFVTDLALESAETVVQEIKAVGGEAWAIKANVVIFEDINRMVEFAVDKAGAIDILVNNAGAYHARSILDTRESNWDSCVDSYLKGTFLCTQAVARKMIECQRRGKIINISSINVFVPVPGLAPYCAAKAGVAMFTKVAALEFAQYGILVNSIAPGPVATPAMKDIFDQEYGRKQFLDHLPIGRIGQPEDIAEVAVFLASSASNYITGHILVADGGMSLVGQPSMLDILGKERNK